MKIAAAAFFVAMILAGCASTRPTLDAELAAIAGDPVHPLASLSVLAIRGGNVVYEGQFGHRRIDNGDPSRSEPANADTMYRVASISKLVTTLGVMKLLEDGRLELDRDVGDYLGYRFRNPHFPQAAITLRMLLSHTSSLRDKAGYYFPYPARLRDVLAPAMWADNAAPGTYFQYANLPWGVIGTVMEKVTGERFDRLMQRLVVEPLGLSGGYNPAAMRPGQLANLATLYRKRPPDDDAKWDPAGPWVAQVDDYSREPPRERAGVDYVPGTNGTLYGPQGNLRASAADLGRVMRMLMNGGELDGRRFLKAETVKLMLTRHWTRETDPGEADFGPQRGKFNAWGLGNQHFLDVGGAGAGDRLVNRGTFAGVGHLGDAWGLTGVFVFNPASRNGVIFLTGGPGFDPATWRGVYSSFYRYEELILTAVFRSLAL